MLSFWLSFIFFTTVYSKAILTNRDRIRAMPKVELHVHLDGSIRPETMLEIAKQKNIDLYGATTVEELKKHIVTSTPTTLAKMLEPFDHFLPLFRDDLDALERIAYEQCEDQAAKSVVYFETRYSPNLLCTDGGKVTSRQVVEAISKGLARGEKDFGVMARQIVCCVRGLEKYAEDVLAIAIEYRERGVVGIDTAGASYGADEQYGPEIVSVFQRAAELGIPTTAHAGEAGFAKQVKKVIETMKVHRVGHGYRIIQDEAIYDKYAVSNKTIHFEACPTSSLMTKSMEMNLDKHAIKRWVKDEVSFSLNTDDPTLFDTHMVNEMVFAHEKFKMSLTQLWQTQLNAAKASFLPAGLKQELIDRIENSKPVATHDLTVKAVQQNNMSDSTQLLRQLKPFTTTDAAILAKISEQVWKHFGDADNGFHAIEKNLDLLESQKGHWINHPYKVLTNETDNLAFYEYARNAQFKSAVEISSSDMFNRWARLPDAEQDKCYEKVPMLYALLNPKKAFLNENATLKVGQPGFSDEQQELNRMWMALGLDVKLFYIAKVGRERLEYEHDLEKRFVGKYNDRSKLSDVTTFDDINSQVAQIPPFSHIQNVDESAAFIVFMEKRRPELLKDPKVAQKRYWAVNNLILKEWRSDMTEEDQQKYYDIARRFIEINSNLLEWQINAKDVYWHEVKEQDYSPAYYTTIMGEWKNVDPERKKRYAEMAVENRKVFLKKYPDFYDFYAWTHCNIVSDSNAAATTLDTPKELEEALKQFDITVTASEKKMYSRDYHFYCDIFDVEAFNEYERSVRAMASESLDGDALWRQFIHLNDKERAIYYDQAFKIETEKEACDLFGKDNCRITKTNENAKEYAKQMALVHKKWENLSAVAKQYYLDTAEKNILQLKKVYPADYDPVPSFMSCVNLMYAVNEPHAYMRNRYSYEIITNNISDTRKARMVYMRREFSKLLAEPGMADLRYFQLKLILERRFFNLTDEERKPYFDLVQRIQEIYKQSQEFPVTQYGVMHKKYGYAQRWDKLSDEDKAICVEEAKQNRLKLIKEFPDVDEHFRFDLYHKEATENFRIPQMEDATESVESILEEALNGEFPGPQEHTAAESESEDSSNTSWEVLSEDDSQQAAGN